MTDRRHAGRSAFVTGAGAGIGRAIAVRLAAEECAVACFCQPHYNASKGGVTMLTKAAAVDLAHHGIRVNAVAPGPVQTGFTPGADPRSPQIPAAVLDRLLIPRLGQPEDIAAAVSFLLSDDASFITGTQLVVDGGWLAR